MARIRSIKPDFFTHAELCDLSPLHRLLFAAMWCHADRDGRLEDRPRELKVKCLPYDDCDVDAMLWDLHRKGQIIRYEVDGHRYLAIPSFASHQKFHRDEKPRGFPPPPAVEVAPSPVPARCQQPAEPVPAPSQPPASSAVNGVRESVCGERESDDGDGAAAAPAAKPPSSSRKKFPAAIEKPTDPPEVWDGMDFWRWAQFIRQKAGCIAEPWPNERAVGSWYSAALMTEGLNVHALKRGFYCFGKSKHWGNADPPFPFAAFMKLWSNFVRREEVEYAAGA